MKLHEMKELIEKIKDEYWMDYGYIGVRTQTQPFALGEMDHRSVVWVDGEETDEELNGVSTTNCESRSVQMHCEDATNGYYGGDHCAIIGGNNVEWGEDDGELIIADPVVLYIIK